MNPLTPRESAALRERVVAMQVRRDRSKPGRTTFWVGGPCDGLVTMEDVRPNGYSVGISQLTNHGIEQALYDVLDDTLVFREWANRPAPPPMRMPSSL